MTQTTWLHVLVSLYNIPMYNSQWTEVAHECSLEVSGSQVFDCIQYAEYLHVFLNDGFVSGGKDKHNTPTLTDYEAPVSFWFELKNLSACLMENVNGMSSFNKNIVL